MSYLSVCMHLHMCVHLGIIQDGKCSGNVKYYNYVQCSFLFFALQSAWQGELCLGSLISDRIYLSVFFCIVVYSPAIETFKIT